MRKIDVNKIFFTINVLRKTDVFGGKMAKTFIFAYQSVYISERSSDLSATRASIKTRGFPMWHHTVLWRMCVSRLENCQCCVELQYGPKTLSSFHQLVIEQKILHNATYHQTKRYDVPRANLERITYLFFYILPLSSSFVMLKKNMPVLRCDSIIFFVGNKIVWFYFISFLTALLRILTWFKGRCGKVLEQDI